MKCSNRKAWIFSVPGCQVVLVRAGNQVKLLLVHPFQPWCDICEFMARSLARGFYFA